MTFGGDPLIYLVSRKRGSGIASAFHLSAFQRFQLLEVLCHQAALSRWGYLRRRIDFEVQQLVYAPGGLVSIRRKRGCL
jgi:hypothetical protein